MSQAKYKFIAAYFVRSVLGGRETTIGFVSGCLLSATSPKEAPTNVIKFRSQLSQWNSVSVPCEHGRFFSRATAICSRKCTKYAGKLRQSTVTLRKSTVLLIYIKCLLKCNEGQYLRQYVVLWDDGGTQSPKDPAPQLVRYNRVKETYFYKAM